MPLAFDHWSMACKQTLLNAAHHQSREARLLTGLPVGADTDRSPGMPPSQTTLLLNYFVYIKGDGYEGKKGQEEGYATV